MGGVESGKYHVSSGVAQGSTMGPIIFTLYINDLHKCIKNGLVIGYADDTSIAVSARNPEDLQRKVRAVAEEMESWSFKNKLILNTRKTVYVPFGPKNELSLDTVTEDHTKFLGVHIDGALTYSYHVESVAAKMNSAYFAILKLKSKLNTASLLSMYYALWRTHTYLMVL